MLMGHSSMSGAATCFAGRAVNPSSANLSCSAPDHTPAKSTFSSCAARGMLTTNSRAASTSPCECREGRIATLSIGGAEHTVPTHARVMMLAFSLPWPATLSSTTGVGSSAVDGLRSIFTWLLLGCGVRVARYRTASRESHDAGVPATTFVRWDLRRGRYAQAVTGQDRHRH